MVVTCFSSYYEKFADGKVVCIDEELPYSLPLGWTWCRLNELGIYRKGPFGSSLTKSMFVPKSEHSIKVYEQKNAIQKDYRLGEYYISEDKFSEMQSFVTKPFDIIVSCAGTIGETYLLPEEAPIGIINQALMRVELYNLDIADYWQLFFAYILLIENEMKGAGSAIKNIPPFEYLKAILVPIPPLQEQKRIIEKYNELTTLISQYTQQKEVLDLLNDNLYPSIKKSILQEAIQGKLVPQDPNDEPASLLLQRIKEEKLRLVKEGKLKKKDVIDSTIFRCDDNRYFEKKGKEVACIDDEIPFEIPESWQWCRINIICSITNGFTPLRTEDRFWRNGDINWFTVEDIRTQGEYINYTAQKITKEATTPDRIVRPGTTLLCCTASVGQCAFTNIPTTTNQQFNALTIKDDYRSLMTDEYLFLFAKTLKDELHRLSGKTTFEFISVKKVGNILVPIPPFNEQKRIVAIVNKSLAGIMSR